MGTIAIVTISTWDARYPDVHGSVRIGVEDGTRRMWREISRVAWPQEPGVSARKTLLAGLRLIVAELEAQTAAE